MSEKTFDAYGCELSGWHIVSAGAGTGKTYNIQILYLRMILRGVTADRILVVTFTKLATQELRGRVRSILQLMARCLTAYGEDEPLPEGSEQVRPFFESGSTVPAEERVTEETWGAFRERVGAALMSFDQAPVETIHSLCNRLQRENAFESGMAFRVQICSDITAQRKWLLSQFWRRLGSGDRALQAWMGEEPLDKERLAMRRWLLSECGVTPGWLLSGLKDAFANESATLNWEGAARLSELEGRPRPERLDESRAELLRAYGLSVRQQAFRYVGAHLEELKERQGFMTYDDMIVRLRESLERSPSLVSALRERYQCALVDEYQDTDSCQNAIFQRIFAEGADDASSGERSLFMIGDPQQAIYAFRGGDVQTFLEVQEGGGLQRHTLNVNYRASDAYIEAMNAFFGSSGAYFSVEKGCESIRFSRILCPAGNGRRLEMPTEWPLLGRMNGGVQELAETLVSLASEGKVRLVERDGRERGVQYSDMAVLVRSRRIGEQMQVALSELGVPSVMVQDTSVFQTPLIREMYVLLRVLNEPGDRELLMRLLGSSWLGLSAAEVSAVRGRPEQVSRLMVFFERVRRQWESVTLMSGMELFLHTPLAELLGAGEAGETVATRLLRDDVGGGLEVLSEVRQLTEALYRLDCERQLGPSGMLKFVEGKMSEWLSGLGRFGGQEDEETVDSEQLEEDVFKLRMPSDRPAVQIMTIHKSKGLEFPLVFVPEFSGATSTIRSRIYHDERRRRCVNMGVGEVAAVRREDLEERRRLMYVAITRARYLCWFFTPTPEKKEPDVAYRPEFLLPSSEVLELDGGVEPVSGELEERRCEEVTFSRDDLRPGWFQASFTMLSRHRAEDEGTSAAAVASSPVQAVSGGTDEGEDEESREPGELGELRLETKWVMVPYEEREGIFRFLGGVRTGLCWHEMFEHLDFTRPAEEQRERIVGCLDRFGQLGRPGMEGRAEREEVFLAMVEDVRTRELLPGWRLQEVFPERCAHEWNFTYHLRRDVTGEEFREVLERHGVPVPETWGASIRGDWVLNGSIDLLVQHPSDGRFYIVDWKTNQLGARLQEFEKQSCLEQEMRWHFYHLQYIIYTVAFVQYYRWLHPEWELTEESYEAVFGGCLYLFVRGFGSPGSAGQTGVYAARPGWKLIRDVEGLLGKKDMEDERA